MRGEVSIYGDAILGYIGNVDESDPWPTTSMVARSSPRTAGPTRCCGSPEPPPRGRGRLDLQHAARQRNALFRNNGDGTFTEVGYVEGATGSRTAIVAPVDIDNDGVQDRAAQHRPGAGNTYAPVIALRNQLDRNALTVALQGKDGNVDGIGARVVAHVGGQKIVREVRGVAGAVQAEPVAYFGLGDASKVDRLEVVWPGGETQVLTDVTAGQAVVIRD